MMKKAIKKLLAALLAVAMVCAMAIAAFAYNTEENLNGTHGYSAFQIFKGVISKDNPKLSGVDWGQNIILPSRFRFKTQITSRMFLRLSANGVNPIITASLLRALYAAISTRMQTQTRNPSIQITPVASTFKSQVII